MIVFFNGNATRVREYRDMVPTGVLVNPTGGMTVAEAAATGLPWGLDNGAFAAATLEPFWAAVAAIRALPDRGGLKFVVLPDLFDAKAKVGLGRGTLYWFWCWLDFVDADPAEDRDAIPAALVGQDGMEDCDWDFFLGHAQAFFIGGSTRWKLSHAAADLAAEARRRGLWVHMGRVNSLARLKYAESIGCDSVDGTGLSRFSRATMPPIERHFRGRKSQPLLWEPKG